VATYLEPYLDCLGRPLEDEKEGYGLKLITFREIVHTKSRTMVDYWLHGLMQENFFMVHPQDALNLGLKDGDTVKVVSASNPEGIWPIAEGVKKPIVGKVKITEMIRPGTVTFSLGFGHWAYGASDIVVDGKVIKGDLRRARGVHANAAMRVDPVLKNMCFDRFPRRQCRILRHPGQAGESVRDVVSVVKGGQQLRQMQPSPGRKKTCDGCIEFIYPPHLLPFQQKLLRTSSFLTL